MAPQTGSASYKKKDGSLALSKDLQSVSWTPAAPGSLATLKIAVSTITSKEHPDAASSRQRGISRDDADRFPEISSKHQLAALR